MRALASRAKQAPFGSAMGRSVPAALRTIWRVVSPLSLDLASLRIVAALWRNDGSGWQVVAPAGFPDEAALHALVEEAPQLLPLSGLPRLVVVGREVPLGGGYADLVAFEPSGRPVLIEVKLAKNAEARRAVVAQILTYAAFLHGLDGDALEQEVLAKELAKRGYADLAAAMSENDQDGSFDKEEFESGLSESLSTGAFRLVLVLDDAPSELVRLIGYFEAVVANLVVDLVTVTPYDIDGSQVMVPQRVDPERLSEAAPLPRSSKPSAGYETTGASDFLDAIDSSPDAHRQDLKRLTDWALSLEDEGLVRLSTYHGKGRWTLLPYLIADDAGLVTIWNDKGASVSVWRSVFERRAPNSIAKIEQIIGGRVGTGNTVRVISDALLTALTDAYREAATSLPAGARTIDRDVLHAILRNIPRGHWTTYGDVAAAIGSPGAAQPVATAIANDSTVENAHRVLLSEGTVSPDWKSTDGEGPEEAERRLKEEGLDASVVRRADPTRRWRPEIAASARPEQG
jgi:alkylated DNA nucleotide flippase Atl1